MQMILFGLFALFTTECNTGSWQRSWCSKVREICHWWTPYTRAIPSPLPPGSPGFRRAGRSTPEHSELPHKWWGSVSRCGRKRTLQLCTEIIKHYSRMDKTSGRFKMQLCHKITFYTFTRFSLRDHSAFIWYLVRNLRGRFWPNPLDFSLLQS